MNSTTPGLFISFEGIDGAGKSSHIEALAQALRDAGREVVATREPGGTPLSEKLRALFLHEPMDALTEALLVFAARREHALQVIVPALQRGAAVLCDRFTDATFAYQGGGRGFSKALLAQLEQTTLGGLLPERGPVLRPDVTFWFDLPAAVAAERLAGARVPDRFEAQPQAFFEQVAQGYAERAAAEPERIARLQAEGTREQVWSQLHAVMVARGWLAAQ